RRAGKRDLAVALGDSYLVSVTRRRKRGFSLPMTLWMREGPLQGVADNLKRTGAPIWDYVSRQAVTEVLSRTASDRWSPLWSLVALNEWMLSLDVSSAFQSRDD
ncbi:MAG: asparagine synthase C-terminal domain-containing protein, partial [Actinomycetota bacterium]|nr:asparagine synthase C-terminal domain-containing protein [Actinomycetota bacterium]